MQTTYVYLVFSMTGTWLSKYINRFGNLDYPHVSISFDSSLNKMYTVGRINVNNPFSGGLVAENISGGVYKKFIDSKCVIYRVPVTAEQMQLLENEIKKHLSINVVTPYRYNFIGLLGILVHMPIKRKNHFFCSQFVSMLLDNSSIWTSPKCHELTKPTDIMNISNKEIIYKGLVRNFSV